MCVKHSSCSTWKLRRNKQSPGLGAHGQESSWLSSPLPLFLTLLPWAHLRVESPNFIGVSLQASAADRYALQEAWCSLTLPTNSCFMKKPIPVTCHLIYSFPLFIRMLSASMSGLAIIYEDYPCSFHISYKLLIFLAGPHLLLTQSALTLHSFFYPFLCFLLHDH